MLLEQIEQHAARLVPRAFQRIDPSEIEICLIECRRHADAFLKTGDRLIAPLRV